jgi:hypothetical protein
MCDKCALKARRAEIYSALSKANRKLFDMTKEDMESLDIHCAVENLSASVQYALRRGK